MADISVNFQHPTLGKIIEVLSDDAMTGQECIDLLISHDFLSSSFGRFYLATKGGSQLDNTKTFFENGVKNNDTIRVIFSTGEGG